MKPISSFFKPAIWLRLTHVFLLVALLSSCQDDDPIIVPADNSGTNPKTILFRYCKDQTEYRVNNIGTSVGSQICMGNLLSWEHVTGVDAGQKWVVTHSNDMGFAIWKMYSDGTISPDRTDYQDWNNNYETFVGYHVGDRGFIFGQDSHDNKWFIQEVGADGKLAEDEMNSGTWHNYYKTCTPVYMNGNTFLFFQTDESDNYWFMTRVNANGNMTDVADGYWGSLWYPVTFYQQDGKGYLVGEFADGNAHGQWFIQAVNPDGTLGAETDRGTWNNYYHAFTTFTSNGHSYIYAGADNRQNNGLNVFIQEVTADGKMGVETSHFTQDCDFGTAIPFTVLDNPGSFRYTIGWDLSSIIIAPAGGWSSLFVDPWNGETKFGGGAALADIDRDAGGRLDAVLMGIQSLGGGDRYYYKVAWNLDNSGKATGWTPALFGPTIGQKQSGGGADIADINQNGTPDLLLMVVDNPENYNSFWYNIGWDIKSDGQVSSWSETIEVGSLGYENAGGGVALGDIDKNGQVDAVFVAIDNPGEVNAFWYTIGQNLGSDGKATSWTYRVSAPCLIGWETGGGGAALADINGNGKLDLVLTGIDNPSGANNFKCYVGWDIDINGNVTGWSPKFVSPSPGNMTIGGGTAVGDINKNGKADLFLMTVDDPYGKD